MTKVQNKKNTSHRHRRVYWWLAAILLLTAAVYFRTVYNDFTFWDDPQQVRENTEIRALTFENIKTMFSRYYVNMYQPLTTLSFAVEYHFFGLNASAFHATNLVLHLVNVVLVFFLVQKLSKRKEVALIAACLFGIHPMHVESVAWITERKDVLYALFYLSALIFYVRYIDSLSAVRTYDLTEGENREMSRGSSRYQKKNFYWMALVLLLLSSLAKSTAATLPLVLILIDWYRRRKFTISVMFEKVPFLLLSLVIGIVSLYSQAPTESDNLMGMQFSLLRCPFLAAYALVFYLVRLIAPIHLSAFQPYELTRSGFLPPIYYFTPIPIIVGAYIVRTLRHTRRDVVFGVLFFLMTIIVNLQIIPISSVIVAERFVYIPYIGLYFVIGQLLLHAFNRKVLQISTHRWLMLSFGLIVVCLLGYQTNQRVAVWNDTITLFTDAEEKDGRTQIGDLILAKAYAYRAEAALIRGDIGIAIQDLSSAISRHPEYHQAFYRRGTARERLGDHKGALDDYTHAIAMNSAIPAYYNDRGIAKMQIGELDSAVVDYTRAIELDPNMGIAYANRAFVYFKMGKQDECCSDLRRAHSLGYADAAKLIQEHCR